MNSFVIYKGEDFGIKGQITFTDTDPSQDINDYELLFKVSTTEFAQTLLAYSSAEKSGDAEINIQADNQFAMNFTSLATSKLSPGTVTISMAIVHTPSGNRKIWEKTIANVVVRASRIKQSEL